MHREPLPIELRGQPFSVTTGARVGLTKGRMGATGLFRPARGARSDTRPATVLELASATAVVLPDDAAFSHFTAAQIHGLPLPPNVGMQPLHTMRPSWKNPTRRKDFRGFRGLERREVVDVTGIAVTSMADTWVDLSPFLPLDDLIVLGDQVARRHDSTEQLREALARRPGPDRQRVALEALTLVRVGSGSPMETLSRLVFVRDGLPEPELNEPIYDEAGEWLATADFRWKKRRVIAEFQGASHFTGFEAGDSDISRRLLAQDHDWIYVEITKLDIFRTGRRQQMLQRMHRYLD